MACVPKTARGKFPWYVTLTAVSLFVFLARPASLYCEEYVYMYTYLTAYRLHASYHYYQIIIRMKHFYTSRVRSEVMTGYL